MYLGRARRPAFWNNAVSRLNTKSIYSYDSKVGVSFEGFFFFKHAKAFTGTALLHSGYSPSNRERSLRTFEALSIQSLLRAVRRDFFISTCKREKKKKAWWRAVTGNEWTMAQCGVTVLRRTLNISLQQPAAAFPFIILILLSALFCIHGLSDAHDTPVSLLTAGEEQRSLLTRRSRLIWLWNSWRFSSEPQSDAGAVVLWNAHVVPAYLLTTRNKPNFRSSKAVIQTVAL